MDQCDTEPGSKYAFCLAVLLRIEQLSSSTHNLPSMLAQVALVLENQVLPTHSDDDAARNTDRSFVDFCVDSMLPPHSSEVEWAPKITTNDIIGCINRNETAVKTKQLSRTKELGPRMAAIFGQCVLGAGVGEQAVIAQFLAACSSNSGLPESSAALFRETAAALTAGDGSVNATDSATSTRYNDSHVSDNPTNAHTATDNFLESVYALFIQGLLCHLAAVSLPQTDHHTRVLREQGNTLMANQAYAQAIHVYTSALHTAASSSRPHVPQLLTNRAVAYIGLNCFPEAITDLNAALVADRTFTPAWVQLGYCHLYMGLGLTALKVYHMALRTMAGTVLPERLAHTADDMVESYQRLRRQSVLPLLVKRVVQSLLLTERRAIQQLEPAVKVQAEVAAVKELLALLAAEALPENRLVFVYPSSYERMLVLPVERANRTNPQILTPDVAQDILANTGFESPAAAAETDANAFGEPETAVSPEAESTGPDSTRTRSGSGPNDAATAARAASQSANIRNLLNSFGQLAEQAQMLDVARGFLDEGQARSRDRQQEQTNQNQTQAQNPVQNSTPGLMMNDVSRAFLDSFAGGVGAILALLFGQPQNRASAASQEQSQQPERQDTEMPEEPDLD